MPQHFLIEAPDSEARGVLSLGENWTVHREIHNTYIRGGYYKIIARYM